MDHHQLDRLLTTLLQDHVPPTVSAEGSLLFDLRSDTTNLAEVVEIVEVADDDDDMEPDRTIVFASDTEAVAVAVRCSGRLAFGRIDPGRSAPVTLHSVTGEMLVTSADERGEFELRELPAGRVQLVVAAPEAGGGPTLRTAWSKLVDTTTEDRAGDGSADELLRRRLATRAATALTRYRQGPTAWPAVDAPLRTGLLEPPIAAVARTLAPAAQLGARRLPRHRWTSDDERLDVVLEETLEGRMTLTMAGALDLASDLLVSVEWTTTTTDGATSDERLSTPLPLESTDRRVATYDVGSALDLQTFGLGAVRVFSADAVTPPMVESSLRHRPYGNAVRAWEELVSRRRDEALREALDRSLGTR